MASETIIPLEELLQPISEDSAVGIDIREDSSPESAYFKIKEARTAARAAERSSLFDTDKSEAEGEWRKLLELAPEILINQSKDLEVASWYTEALVRRHGYAGLRDGFKLIQGLIDQYWDDLFPLPDEDGLETRVASLVGLNGEGAEGVLIAPIRNVDITEGGEPGPFNFWKYQQALEVDKTLDDEARAEKAAQLGFSSADVDRAVADSSESFFVDLVDDIDEAINTFRDVGRLLDERCGINDSPPSSNIINALEECLGTVRHIGRHKLPQPEVESETAGASEGGAGLATGSVSSRADAFRKLTEISAFFRKTEPHSPISYILERAVKWGDLPLDDLIRELIPDHSARNFYGSLTGIRTEDD